MFESATQDTGTRSCAIYSAGWERKNPEVSLERGLDWGQI